MVGSAKVDPEERGSATEGGLVKQDEGTRRAVALWLRIVRLANTKNTLLGERLRARKLSPAQFDVIAQIGPSKRLTQRELAVRLLVTEGNVTQLLDKLEKQGLVTRNADGRCNRLALTAMGRSIYREIVPEQNRLIAEQFSPLTPGEQEELSRLLRKLRHPAG